MTIWTNGKKYRIKNDSGYWLTNMWQPMEFPWLWLARLIAWDENRAKKKREKKELIKLLEWRQVE